MADPLSVACGVAQVAQTGFQLVETIYSYTNSVRRAEQQLQPIAEYVQVTSTAFEHIASHLRDDELTTLYKPALLRSTEDALRTCEAAFGSPKTYVQTLSSDGDGKSGGPITTKTKFTWRWKQKELESHQVHLERCKSTVSVLLGTLTLVSVAKNLKCSTSNNKDILGTKLELQRLLKMEEEAKQKEAQFVALTSSTQPGDISAQQLDDAEKARDISESTDTALENTWTGSTVASINSIALPVTIQQRHVEPCQSLSSQLYACEAAMDKLSSTLREAIRKWERFQKYEPRCLVSDFQTLHTAMGTLTTYERECGLGHEEVANASQQSRQGPEHDPCTEPKKPQLSQIGFAKHDISPDNGAKTLITEVSANPKKLSLIDLKPSEESDIRNEYDKLFHEYGRSLACGDEISRAELTQQLKTLDDRRNAYAAEWRRENEHRIYKAQLFESEIESEFIAEPNHSPDEDVAITYGLIEDIGTDDEVPDLTDVDELLKQWTLIEV